MGQTTIECCRMETAIGLLAALVVGRRGDRGE